MGEGAWLVAFLVAQRLVELCFAQLNTRRLREMGGIEFGAAHYPFIVILHAAWIVGLLILGHDRVIDPFWLSVFIVLPGAATIARGPYRWLRHPNYLIVALEVAVVPLALGLPVFAYIFSAANAALLAYRIRIENEAQAWAAQPT